MFNNKENEEIPPEKPRMKIGKLDPRSLFDKGQERQTAVVQEKEMYNNVVIGKLNTKNIFENDQVSVSSVIDKSLNNFCQYLPIIADVPQFHSISFKLLQFKSLRAYQGYCMDPTFQFNTLDTTGGKSHSWSQTVPSRLLTKHVYVVS